jgi:hypothetical protein
LLGAEAVMFKGSKMRACTSSSQPPGRPPTLPASAPAAANIMLLYSPGCARTGLSKGRKGRARSMALRFGAAKVIWS